MATSKSAAAIRRHLSPLRRVVPPGYAQVTLELAGTTPLLMNSGEADRDSDLYRAYVMLGQKKRKSLDDDARLREIEWALRLYLDDDLGPYVPGKNVKEMLRSAATKWSKGEDVKRSLIVVQSRIPLEYEGPRDQDGLWAAGYRYTTMVANNGFNAGRVLRCRPMFPDWALHAEIAYDPEDIDADFLAAVVERSQKYGIGDYRPAKGGDFGTFVPALLAAASHKAPARAAAAKRRSEVEEAAHAVSVARVMVEA